MKGLFRVAVVIALAIAPISIAHAKNWEPTLGTGDALYPALILATRNIDSETILKREQSPQYLGDPMGLYGIKLRTTQPDTKVRVTVTIDGLSEASTFEETLPKANQEYTIMPFMRYKPEALGKVKQPYPTTAIFSVSVDGALAQEIAKKLTVRTVNDVPYAIKQGDKNYDTTFLFGALVNENASAVDEILEDALAHNAVGSFQGYTADSQETYHQLFAIWNALQRKGVRFSSVTTPSGYSKQIQSQHVRSADESYHNAQANCVDGSVLMASALYKIGMCPVLVIKPGHMFLGVYTDKASCEKKLPQNITFIETTEIGNINPLLNGGQNGLSKAQKNWRFKTDDSYLASTSYRSLMKAVENGRRQFNSMVPALKAKQPGYTIIDIRDLRSMGIIPISNINSAEHNGLQPNIPTPKQIIRSGNAEIIQY